MSSQNLTAEHINKLVDFLEQDCFKEEETLYGTPDTTTADTLVQVTTPDESKPKKSTLSSHLRKLSLDKYIHPPDGRSLSLHTLLRRSTDEKQTETPLPTVVKESHAFGCFWPEPQCGARFTTLPSRKTHRAQHWICWESGDDSASAPMPGIASILA
jgi:hypothetical protein